jgi:hypothetical protein
MHLGVLPFLLVLTHCPTSAEIQDPGSIAAATDPDWEPAKLVTRTTLREQAVLVADREARNLALQSQPATTPPRRTRRVSRTKSVMLGAAISGGIGAAVGAGYCRDDCGGWPGKAPTVFGLAGGGVGAGVGLLVALVAERVP